MTIFVTQRVLAILFRVFLFRAAAKKLDSECLRNENSVLRSSLEGHTKWTATSASSTEGRFLTKKTLVDSELQVSIGAGDGKESKSRNQNIAVGVAVSTSPIPNQDPKYKSTGVS